MSYVCGVVLVFKPGFDREAEDILRDINTYEEFQEGCGFTDLTAHTGGTKHPQMEIAGGGFNYLDVARFLAHLRGIDWGGPTAWANAALQNENDHGAGWVSIYRGPEADECGPVFAEANYPAWSDE